MGARFCHALLTLTLLFAPGTVLAQPVAAAPGQVVPPKAISTEVSYPESATGSGTIVLELTVDAAGRVVPAGLVPGDEARGGAALAQAQAFGFEPATRDGRPV